MKLLNLDITRIAHDCFRIAGTKVVYTDPFKVTKNDEAHVVAISHEHFDHMSIDDLKKVIHPGSTIVASPLCQEALAGIKVRDKRFLDPIARITVGTPKTGEVIIETLPAYNINKFSEPGKVFHPQGEKRLGFIIRMDGTSVYFAGDSDLTPEMRAVKCDIALLPVSGTYVMTAEEAAEAAAAINPKIAVPMHYGAIVGTEDDAKKFKSLVKNCQVEII